MKLKRLEIRTVLLHWMSVTYNIIAGCSSEQDHLLDYSRSAPA